MKKRIVTLIEILCIAILCTAAFALGGCAPAGQPDVFLKRRPLTPRRACCPTLRQKIQTTEVI